MEECENYDRARGGTCSDRYINDCAEGRPESKPKPPLCGPCQRWIDELQRRANETPSEKESNP